MNTKQRISDRLQAYRETDRAVSPVIGVILMVAITVILAAVIGAFVLGLGGSQDTAPQPSFSIDQETSEHQELEGSGSSSCTTAESASDNQSYTTVSFDLRGGDNLKQNELHIGYNPDASASNSRGINMVGEKCGTYQVSRSTDALWNPDTKTTIEPPAGATVAAHLRPDKKIGGQKTDKLLDGSQVCQVYYNGSALTLNDQPTDTRVNNCQAGQNQTAQTRNMDLLKDKDQISIVWQAQGSDKSSRLANHEVDK